MDYVLGNFPISNKFKELGVFKFNDACEWVRSLPYRRNSIKEDPLIVLNEKCGTCSSKHELIKRLAEENNFSGCKLILCIFKMSSLNTPGVETVLGKYDLSYIPEAHVYIILDGKIHDLTFPGNPKLLYQNDIIHTEEIVADQIRSYKVESHKTFIKNWLKKFHTSYSFQAMWSIREECISALSQ